MGPGSQGRELAEAGLETMPFGPQTQAADTRHSLPWLLGPSLTLRGWRLRSNLGAHGNIKDCF